MTHRAASLQTTANPVVLSFEMDSPFGCTRAMSVLPHAVSLFLSVLALAACQQVFAAASSGPVQVKGYTRSDGTTVAPYTRSAPNGTKADNLSARGSSGSNTGESVASTGNSAGEIGPVSVS